MTSPAVVPDAAGGGAAIGGAPSRADVCVLACAEAWRGAGEVLASAFGVAPSLGARLARLTFADDLLISDGEAILLADAVPLGGESVAAGAVVEGWLPFRAVFDVVASGRRHVMMMPSQLDAYGNMNISCVGDHARPTRQLIGVRGAPGNTVNHPTSYWVPKHSPRVFVDRVDVVAGVGYDRAGAGADGRSGSAARFHGLGRVVTDLAVLDFETDDRRMRLASVHPGVSVAEVVAATGFALAGADGPDGSVTVTPEPTVEQVALIASLDPKGVRYREVPDRRRQGTA
jgi:acyl CoA:acetate/3-ketoacid CoA transferase beta subunit